MARPLSRLNQVIVPAYQKEDGMPGREDDPLEFSDLADEARAIAERMPASGAKETLLNITRAYEAMLKRADKKPISN